MSGALSMLMASGAGGSGNTSFSVTTANGTAQYVNISSFIFYFDGWVPFIQTSTSVQEFPTFAGSGGSVTAATFQGYTVLGVASRNPSPGSTTHDATNYYIYFSGNATGVVVSGLTIGGVAVTPSSGPPFTPAFTSQATAGFSPTQSSGVTVVTIPVSVSTSLFGNSWNGSTKTVVIT